MLMIFPTLPFGSLSTLLVFPGLPLHFRKPFIALHVTKFQLLEICLHTLIPYAPSTYPLYAQKRYGSVNVERCLKCGKRSTSSQGNRITRSVSLNPFIYIRQKRITGYPRRFDPTAPPRKEHPILYMLNKWDYIFFCNTLLPSAYNRVVS